MSEAQTEQSRQPDQRLLDIEAKLLAQEHRWTHVLHNLWYMDQWPKNDPRRQAVVSAFLWRIVAPGAIVVAGGGAVAVITLVFLALQTNLLRDQNSLIKDQNSYFKEQINKMQEQNALQQKQADAFQTQYDRERRTELIRYLYETNEHGVVGNARTRSESFVEFVRLEETRFPTARNSRIDLTGAHLKGIKVQFENLENLDLSESSLEDAEFYRCNFSNFVLHADKQGRFEKAGAVRPRFQHCVFMRSEFPIRPRGTTYFFSISINGSQALVTDSSNLTLEIPSDHASTLSFEDMSLFRGLMMREVKAGVVAEIPGLLAEQGWDYNESRDFTQIILTNETRFTSVLSTLRDLKQKE